MALPANAEGYNLTGGTFTLQAGTTAAGPLPADIPPEKLQPILENLIVGSLDTTVKWDKRKRLSSKDVEAMRRQKLFREALTKVRR